MALKDEIRFTIECPQCKKKIEQSLGDVQRNPKIACTGCGSSIEFKGADPIAGSLDDLDKALRDIGAKRKR